MRLTQALLGEHAVFAPLFGHIEAAVPQADDLGRVRALGELLGAALLSHARLENELLFDALDRVMNTRMGPVAVMRQEHDMIEGGLERLPGVADLDTARRLLLQVVVAARSHFAKEEQVLFPMSAQLLGESFLQEQGQAWAARRKVIEAESPTCGAHPETP